MYEGLLILGAMDFSSFNLTPQVFASKSFPTARMGDDFLYSFPLNGHLDGAKPKVQQNSWTFFTPPSKIAQQFSLSLPCIMPQQTKMCENIKKNILSYLVGGFVGSKSQRNEAKSGIFPIGEIIGDLLTHGSMQKQRFSGMSSQYGSSSMLNMFFEFPEEEVELSSCHLPELKKDVSSCQLSTCFADKFQKQTSDCSDSSDEDDYIVFEQHDWDDSEFSEIDDSEDDDDSWADEIDICSMFDGISPSQRSNTLKEVVCEEVITKDDSPEWVKIGVSSSNNVMEINFASQCYDSEEDETEFDKNKQEAVNRWNDYYKDVSGSTERLSTVRFSDKKSVLVMRVWDFAHRAARIGPWEMAVRDRGRFRERISRTEKIISYVFQEKHREKMRKYIENHLR